jgi:hypothetical protein
MRIRFYFYFLQSVPMKLSKPACWVVSRQLRARVHDHIEDVNMQRTLKRSILLGNSTAVVAKMKLKAPERCVEFFIEI